MTAQSQNHERRCAEVAMLLQRLPPERAEEVLREAAYEYLKRAMDKGWAPQQAGEMTVELVQRIGHYMHALAASRKGFVQ
jgi:hypothetical protein